jgi:hypothetical protein
MIGEDRRLVIDLPPAVKPGLAEADVVIHSVEPRQQAHDERSALLASLRTAGVIRDHIPVPPNARQLTEVERIEIEQPAVKTSSQSDYDLSTHPGMKVFRLPSPRRLRRWERGGGVRALSLSEQSPLKYP